MDQYLSLRELAGRPRVFISHSSQDRSFVERLAKVLRAFSINVWYSEWEIGVGDSIVDKVFEGLDASAHLAIVLSKASVASRWVREELTVAVMRRLSEQNIRILPVLIENCDVPSSLKHIKYADFRTEDDVGLVNLIESISPGERLRQRLEECYQQMCDMCDRLAGAKPSDDVHKEAMLMFELLESALGMRVDLQFRQSPSMLRNMTFFEKIGALGEQGIDVRSDAWRGLVTFRNHQAHRDSGRSDTLSYLMRLMGRDDGVKTIDDRDDREAAGMYMEALKKTMHTICFVEAR